MTGIGIPLVVPTDEGVPIDESDMGIEALDTLEVTSSFVLLFPLAVPLLPFSCQAGIPGALNPNALARFEGGAGIGKLVAVVVEGNAGVEMEVERGGSGATLETGMAREGEEREAVIEFDVVGAAGAGPVGRPVVIGAALVLVRSRDLSDFNSVDKSARDWI